MLRFTNVDQKPTRLPPVYGYKTHPLLPLRQALDPITSQIHELDHFIKIAKNACHFPSEHDLKRDESAAIYLYTMDWGEQSLYRQLNQILRMEDRSVLVPWYGYLRLFDNAIQKLPNQRMNLWRGINVNVSKNFKEDDEITWWALNSCSSSLKVVESFLGPSATLFMIEAKNGKDISSYSNFPTEKEIILGLGTRLRVVSNALGHSSLNVVHLIELSDEDEEELNTTTGYQESITHNKFQTINVHTYDNGDRYEGEWKNGKRHGKGTMDYASGAKYTGIWVNDEKVGHGCFVWPSGNRYEGQFKNDRMNGKGTFYYTGGDTYTGEIVNAKYEGFGVYIWANGDRYEGRYKDDKRNGKGRMLYSSGEVKEGTWVNDKFTG